MKAKITVLTFLAVTAGVFVYTRPHNAMPSDLRDAVADSGAINMLKDTASVSDGSKGTADVPEPKAEKVVSSGIGMPYKTYDIVCEGDGQKLRLYWDMSKKPFLPVSVLLNGADETSGVDVAYDGKMKATIYFKRGVFVLALPDSGKKKHSFHTVAKIGDRQINLVCTEFSAWHIFR